MSDNKNKLFNSEIETIEEFVERFKVQYKSEIDNENVSNTQLLVNVLPTSVVTDVQRKLLPTRLSNATFEQIYNQLISSYSVKKSVIGAAVSFVTRKQKPGESIEEYSKSLNDLASQCAYQTCCRDRMLRDIFVSGLRSSKLVGTLITECEDKSFQSCVQRAKLLEQASIDVEDINPVRIHKTANPTTNKKYDSKPVPSNYTCIRCGTKAKHYANKCYALKMTCNICSNKGHLAKVCRSKKKTAVTQRSYFVDEREEAAEEVDHCQYVTINHLKGSTKNSNEGNFLEKVSLGLNHNP